MSKSTRTTETEATTEVTETETVETLSPYKATTIVNELLAAAGVTDKEGGIKKLPPQMLYQYCNKGYIKAAKDEAGKWQITVPDLHEWVADYITKTAKRAEARKAKQEAELKGEAEGQEPKADDNEFAEAS